MIALYLDYELDDEEQVDVQLAVGEPIELTRIPWLFPVREDDDPETPPIEPETVRPHLRRAGLAEVSSERVLLVAPQEIRWYASLAEAIHQETGLYPLLIQPEIRRAELGCPGPLRIIDMHAYMQGDDSQLPPWLLGDEELDDNL